MSDQSVNGPPKPRSSMAKPRNTQLAVLPRKGGGASSCRASNFLLETARGNSRRTTEFSGARSGPGHRRALAKPDDATGCFRVRCNALFGGWLLGQEPVDVAAVSAHVANSGLVGPIQVEEAGGRRVQLRLFAPEAVPATHLALEDLPSHFDLRGFLVAEKPHDVVPRCAGYRLARSQRKCTKATNKTAAGTRNSAPMMRISCVPMYARVIAYCLSVGLLTF